MGNSKRHNIIRILKILLVIDNPEIIKYSLESLIEDLEEVDYLVDSESK